MAQPNFDYAGAREAGYSDEEIKEFLGSLPSYKSTNTGSAWQNILNNASNFFGNLGNPTAKEKEQEPSPEDLIERHLLKNLPNFDVKGALDAGYDPDEINAFLNENQPKRSNLEKGGRIAGQFALGLAENAALPYEIGVAPLSSKEAQNIPYREDVGSEIEDLMAQKASGQWSPQDEKFLQHLQEQIQDPRKSMENAQTLNVGIRDLAEKATGIDLHPEGVLEKAAQFSAYLKNPSKLAGVFKTGVKFPDIVKAFAPTGKEALRGLGAGAGLEAAEQGNFGPIGTLASTVVGDVIGHGVGAGLSGAKKLLTQPKKTLAEVAAIFTPKDKRKLQQNIIEDFRRAGIQADLGTITDSNLIKWTQSRLAQSGLAGKALDNFRHEVTDQIKTQYRELAEGLGNARFANSFEAGEVLKDNLKRIRDADLAEARGLYTNANKSLRENAQVNTSKLGKLVLNLEKELKPGQIKSGEQQAVLNALEKLKRDIFDSEGNLIYGNVKDLMNNKIALNDIIDYEVQGGAKQLLKGIVSELDRTIISHGKENPTFAKNYVMANKKFADHAKTFRNKDINLLLRTQDPSQIMGRMNSLNGIRNLNKILSKTQEGRELFKDLTRLKLDEVIGNNLVDSTTQQVKLGTFSKLLQKGKNREIIKEILSVDAFKRLEKLQKNAGRLADAADKFYNASKSGVVAADAAVIAKGMSDIAHLLYGNPWPLMKTSGGILGARKLSQLLSDSEFLKLTEEAILVAEKGNNKEMINAFEKLRPYVLQAIVY